MITTWTTLLITGLRGNGKTLRAVGMMAKFIKAGIPVFACNFTDLTLPGVQFLDDANDWQSLPPGSVLFVDEAQRFWRSRRAGDPPPAVIAMETQRHDAVRIVLLTQQPTFLDKHVRSLVDTHEHLIRRAGLPMSQLYAWERCKDEPENPANVELAEKSLYTFEKEFFGTYRSAEEHHIKKKIPARAKLIAAAVVGVGLLFWLGVGKVKPKESEAVPAVSSAADTTGKADSPSRNLGRRRVEYKTAQEYVKVFHPRIDAMPWTAPGFDGREVASDPRVFCSSAAPGLNADGDHVKASCHCLTEQGTRYGMPDDQCRVLAEIGEAYNPFRKPQRDQQRQTAVQGHPAAMDANASAPLPGSVIEGDQMTGYGDIGVGNTEAAPR